MGVVLAPGLLCDARLWDGVRARLAYASTVVDLRHDRTLEAMAARILREAPPRFVLAGFSMGGMAGVLAAARARRAVAGLLVLSTHGDLDGPERRRAREAQIDEADRKVFADIVANRLVPGAFADPSAQPQAAALTAAMAHAMGVDVYVRQVRALVGRPDIGTVARTLALPTRILTGAEDRAAPPDAAARLACAIPGAVFDLVPNVGHMLPLERPDLVAAAIHDLVVNVSLEAA